MSQKVKTKTKSRAATTDADKKTEQVKRVTIHVSPKLHTRIKVACALRGTTMCDEIRAALQKHFAEKA